MPLAITYSLVLEVLGSTFSIVFSLLLMKERIGAWFFGITASILSMILFYETRLYAQSVISIYYAAIGIYGWIYWAEAKRKDIHIKKWELKTHLVFILVFAMASILAAWLFRRYTDSASPYLDSFLTLFGLLASLKEARKILTSWIYWLVINLLSSWLYYTQGLNFYAGMMILYAGICVPGYLNWLRIYKLRNNLPS